MSTRGSPVGSRAPRGEDTSEPVPRPCRGRVGPSGQLTAALLYPIGCLFYGAIPGLLSLPVAVSMPWFTCRIAGKVADGCKATWTNAQRLPRRGEPPRRSRWGGGESTARRIKRPRRYTHPSKKPNQKTIWFGFCFPLIFNTHARLDIAGGYAKATPSLALASPRHYSVGRKTAPKG